MLKRFLMAVLASGLIIPGASYAEEVDGVANYAFSVFIGTGAYRIGDRTIYNIRLPLRWDLREPDYESGKVGLRLLAPVSIGITNFKDFEDIPDLDVNDLQAITFAPGIEAQIPFRKNWLLKPFIQGGLGWDMHSSARSWVFGTGTRLRGWYGENENWIIGGELLLAAQRPKGNDPSSSFTRIGIGAEYKYQTKWLVFGRQLSWHGRLLHYRFTNPADIDPPYTETDIQNSTEVGISFGINPPVNIFGYKFRQGGIGYEKFDEATAIKLFTTFPF